MLSDLVLIRQHHRSQKHSLPMTCQIYLPALNCLCCVSVNQTHTPACHPRGLEGKFWCISKGLSFFKDTFEDHHNMIADCKDGFELDLKSQSPTSLLYVSSSTLCLLHLLSGFSLVSASQSTTQELPALVTGGPAGLNPHCTAGRKTDPMWLYTYICKHILYANNTHTGNKKILNQPTGFSSYSITMLLE